MARMTPRHLVLIGLVLATACLIGLWWLNRGATEDKNQAERQAAQADAEAQAARRALEAQCDVGIRSACDQLVGIEERAPQDDQEVQDQEIQEPEVQEPERDDPDPDDPEVQNPERQDPENQNPEREDGEPNDPDPDDPDSNDPDPDDPDPNDNDPDDPENQDPEEQEEEIQDPEIDDPEVQDPEIDDPDPNSAIEFAIRDECNPAGGDVVTGVDLAWERNGTIVTLVLTCTTRTLPIPGP